MHASATLTRSQDHKQPEVCMVAGGSCTCMTRLALTWRLTVVRMNTSSCAHLVKQAGLCRWQSESPLSRCSTPGGCARRRPPWLPGPRQTRRRSARSSRHSWTVLLFQRCDGGWHVFMLPCAAHECGCCYVLRDLMADLLIHRPDDLAHTLSRGISMPGGSDVEGRAHQIAQLRVFV